MTNGVNPRDSAFERTTSVATIQIQDPIAPKTMSVSPIEASRLREGKTLNINQYATKKTIAQGMLDIALLTANASQLKYILTVGRDGHQFYDLMLGLIIGSLVLQIIIAVMFMVIGLFDINRPDQQKAADVLNNIIVVGVFVISILNVVINGFGIEHSNNEVERVERLRSQRLKQN